MKFVNAKYEIWEPAECTANNILKAIERAAKVCYKSENNIKDDSALPFVKSLIKRGHTSCLEHGSIYIRINLEKVYINKSYINNFVNTCFSYIDLQNDMYDDPRIHISLISDEMYIYTNARFIYEKCPKMFWDIILDRELPDGISLFTPAENDPYRRQTVFFTADQRITEEFIRHRVASPNKESTRYCCYSSDKHDNQLTYIIPLKFKNIIHENDDVIPFTENNSALVWKIGNNYYRDNDELSHLLNYYKWAELTYIGLTTEYGWRAEEARITLPLGTKADLVLTNSLIDWCYGRNENVDSYEADIDNGEVNGKRIKGFFGLRTDGAAHPQARELAIPLMNDFENRNWIINNA